MLVWWSLPSRASVAASELKKVAADTNDQSPLATLIRAEADQSSPRQIAVSAMPCFWSGEGFYGAIKGVYKTTPGMIGADEVVGVEFDPSIISYQDLMTQARAAGKATKIYCRSDEQLVIAKAIVGQDAIRSDAQIKVDEYPKWYILQTPLKSIPMTPAQSCRINSALHANEDIEPLLTPAQKAMYETAKQQENSK